MPAARERLTPCGSSRCSAASRPLARLGLRSAGSAWGWRKSTRLLVRSSSTATRAYQTLATSPRSLKCKSQRLVTSTWWCLVPRARTYPWPAKRKVSPVDAQVCSSTPSTSLPGAASGAELDLLFGKTCLEPSAPTQDETLQRWLTHWRVWPEPVSRPKAGVRRAAQSVPKQWSNGPLSTRNGSEWRSGAVACLLSQTLETGPVDSRFFLSPKACEGILRRAEKRGKKLPPALYEALTAVALGRTSTATAG